MAEPERLIPRHGGYRRLKSFQVAQLVYDVTVRFCGYIDRRSRTCDQMVQAARSGVQNIAEGSQASGTSKKTEMKLTGVARSSLEELRLDYQDFLGQRGLAQWEPEYPALVRFKARRCATLEQVQAWVQEERERARTTTDKHGQTQTSKSVRVGEGPCASASENGQEPLKSAQIAPVLARRGSKSGRRADSRPEGGIVHRAGSEPNEKNSYPLRCKACVALHLRW